MTHARRQVDGYFEHVEQYEGPDSPFKAGRVELDTMTCSHCNSVVLLNPQRKRDRGWCFRCNRYLCDLCNGVYARTGECFPVAQKLELAVADPGAGVGIGDQTPTSELRRFAEDNKPYPGVWVPGKD